MVISYYNCTNKKLPSKVIDTQEKDFTKLNFFHHTKNRSFFNLSALVEGHEKYFIAISYRKNEQDSINHNMKYGDIKQVFILLDEIVIKFLDDSNTDVAVKFTAE